MRNELIDMKMGFKKRVLISAVLLAIPTLTAAASPQTNPATTSTPNAQPSQQAALDKYALEEYNYCDSKVLAAFWGHKNSRDAKVRLGQKMLRWGPDDGAVIMDDARAEALASRAELPCTYEDGGFTYKDAELLAKYWGTKDLSDAKVKMDTMMVQGSEDLINSDLNSARQAIPQTNPATTSTPNAQPSQQAALDKYALEEYNYCDSKVLAAFWGHKNSRDAKVRLGQKMLRWGPDDGAVIMDDARAEALASRAELPCTYEDGGFTYKDAELLAKYWGTKDLSDAKVKMDTMMVQGSEDLINSDLNSARQAIAQQNVNQPTWPATGSYNYSQMEKVQGTYQRSPAQNGWHTGNIERVGNTLQWTNLAGKSWKLAPDFQHARLQTGSDNPYYKDGRTTFQLIEKNGQIEGFRFGSEVYLRVATVMPITNPPANNPVRGSGSLAEIFSFDADSTGITSVAFTPDSRHIVSGGWENKIKVWDAATGRLQSTIDLAGKGDLIIDLALSPDGKYVATANRDTDKRSNTVMVFDLKTRREAFSPNRRPPDSCNDVAFSPSGKHFAASCFDGSNGDATLQVWDAKTGKATFTIQGASSPVLFTANGEGLAATYNGANGVKAWSISARQVAGDIANFSLKSADFNWDSSTLVGGGYNGELKSWNTISNQVLATYNGHTDTINGVLYSPNRKHVASISKDKTLRLWQADNGKQLAVFRGPGEIESLAFSPNGGHLVIGGTGGKITLLSIKTGASTNSKPITPSVPPRVQTPAPPPTRVYRPAPAPVPTQVQRPKTVPSVPAA